MGGSREDKLPLYCPSQGVVGHGFSLYPIARCHSCLLCDSLCSPVARHKAEASSVKHQASGFKASMHTFPSFLSLSLAYLSLHFPNNVSALSSLLQALFPSTG